jgi:hypothetical protein
MKQNNINKMWGVLTGTAAFLLVLPGCPTNLPPDDIVFTQKANNSIANVIAGRGAHHELPFSGGKRTYLFCQTQAASDPQSGSERKQSAAAKPPSYAKFGMPLSNNFLFYYFS